VQALILSDAQAARVATLRQQNMRGGAVPRVELRSGSRRQALLQALMIRPRHAALLRAGTPATLRAAGVE